MTEITLSHCVHVCDMQGSGGCPLHPGLVVFLVPSLLDMHTPRPGDLARVIERWPVSVSYFWAWRMKAPPPTPQPCALSRPFAGCQRESPV